MKGTLSKTESGWVVQYWDIDPYHKGPTGQTLSRVNELPLHPDNIPTQAEDHFWIDGKEVDFEVILGIPHDLEPTNGSTLAFEAVEYAKLIFQTKPGFVEKRTNQMLEHLANEEFKNIGDEGLFPNHTDKDIWTAGFKAGYLKK
jgi:hypothetical protein